MKYLLLPLIAIVGGLALFTSCSTTHRPPSRNKGDVGSYSDARLREVLSRHVSSEGKVDYAALTENTDTLASYYQQIATTSPDSNPELFPTSDDKLAYWINAYNATVMWNVLQHYPIKSVLDVRPEKIGFFFNQRFEYGGTTTNLYFIENGVIRKRFSDPRFHFALNCASIGCPKLPQTPFSGDQLDQQLERETRKFINSEEYVRVDPATGTLYLSSIFKWYKKDFTRWLEKQHPSLPPTLASYVRLYAEPMLAAELDALGAGVGRVEFLAYDWSLNAQN